MEFQKFKNQLKRSCVECIHPFFSPIPIAAIHFIYCVLSSRIVIVVVVQKKQHKAKENFEAKFFRKQVKQRTFKHLLRTKDIDFVCKENMHTQNVGDTYLSTSKLH